MANDTWGKWEQPGAAAHQQRFVLEAPAASESSGSIMAMLAMIAVVALCAAGIIYLLFVVLPETTSREVFLGHDQMFVSTAQAAPIDFGAAFPFWLASVECSNGT